MFRYARRVDLDHVHRQSRKEREEGCILSIFKEGGVVSTETKSKAVPGADIGHLGGI